MTEEDIKGLPCFMASPKLNVVLDTYHFYFYLTKPTNN